MPERQNVHDIDGCNSINEKPTENEKVAIYLIPNDELIVGYYLNNKWFHCDQREIQGRHIRCWHKHEK